MTDPVNVWARKIIKSRSWSEIQKRIQPSSLIPKSSQISPSCVRTLTQLISCVYSSPSSSSSSTWTRACNSHSRSGSVTHRGHRPSQPSADNHLVTLLLMESRNGGRRPRGCYLRRTPHPQSWHAEHRLHHITAYALCHISQRREVGHSTRLSPYQDTADREHGILLTKMYRPLYRPGKRFTIPLRDQTGAQKQQRAHGQLKAVKWRLG